ncbi:MAG: DNA-binding XRE family transcriptional regulator [Gammaproteobacteria bacterium]|jgi:DNA-binding XRE family transcriptional regulator
MVTQSSSLKPDPRAAAEQVIAAHKDELEWLDAFSAHLDRHRAGHVLAGILSTWDLSQSETARLLGISRQAVGKWIERGAPADRAKMIGDLAAATDLLVHYIKRDRIPAVVRRPIPAMNNHSLVDLLERGDTPLLLATCREMFDFQKAHG